MVSEYTWQYKQNFLSKKLMKYLDSSHMRQMNRGWLVWEGILLWMATRRLLSILSIAHNFELPGNHITAVFRYRVQRSTYAAYITPKHLCYIFERIQSGQILSYWICLFNKPGNSITLLFRPSGTFETHGEQGRKYVYRQCGETLGLEAAVDPA